MADMVKVDGVDSSSTQVEHQLEKLEKDGEIVKLNWTNA